MNYNNLKKTELVKRIKVLEKEIKELRSTLSNLGQEHELLHILMNFSQDRIYFKDLKSRFTRISMACAKHFGMNDPSEALGKTDFDIFKNPHAQEAFDDEQRIIQTGMPVLGKIEKESSLDEPEQWVITSKGPIYDGDNNIVGTFGISRDVTELKKYEDELQRSKENLEKCVADRTVDLTSANIKLEERIAQLDFITATAFEMAQKVEPMELLPVILNAFISRFSDAEATLCKQYENRYLCVAATGPLDSETGRSASEKALVKFTQNQLQQSFMVENWPDDDFLNKLEWPDMHHRTCYMAIPLLAENRTLAIVQIFVSQEAAEIFREEEKVLYTLATQSAVSLSNAIKYQEVRDKARMQGELSAARSIQKSLTPQYKPSIPHVNLKGVYYPAFEVSGDYLDYFQTEEGYWVAVIADVCGKGVPAALLMAQLRTSFRIEANTISQLSAKKLLVAVNNTMRPNLDTKSFVTTLCLVIEPEGRSMSYARAGHPCLVKIHAGNNEVEMVDIGGIALGLIQGNERFSSLIEECAIELKAGDRYLIYTDGLTEANNPEKDHYLRERLLQLLKHRCPNEPEVIIKSIMADVKLFTRGAPYNDDLTMLAMQVV